jgi:hypothetical protein
MLEFLGIEQKARYSESDLESVIVIHIEKFLLERRKVRKLLIHDRREPTDRARDLPCTHDAIEFFGDELPELRKLWQGTVRPFLSPEARRSIEAAPTVLLGEVNDSVREAVITAPERIFSPLQLIGTCEVGHSAIPD